MLILGMMYSLAWDFCRFYQNAKYYFNYSGTEAEYTRRTNTIGAAVLTGYVTSGSLQTWINFNHSMVK